MCRLQYGDVAEKPSIYPQRGVFGTDALIYSVSCSLAPKILKLFQDVQFYRSQNLFLLLWSVPCGEKTHRWMWFVRWCIYLFIHILLLLMFLTSFFCFALAYPWCMMDSERGSCRWNWHIWNLWLICWKVFSEKFLCSAFRKRFTHEWLQVKTENHFCFLFTVPASHPCQILICCVAAPSVKRLGMIIDLHKKCMTLFVSCRTRHFQTIFFPFVWTLFVAWVTKVCFDSCGKSFFRIYFYRADGVNHIILYL